MSFHKIDADSVNSVTNALDFFSLPPTNVSVSSAKIFEILTSNPLTDIPYHFKIHSSDNFIDPNNCYLFTEFRIRKENNNGLRVNLEATDNVAPIQLIGQTFINNMRIMINGREIFNGNSLMAYKSYLTHELSFSPVAKTSQLEAAGYIFDNGQNLETGNAFTQGKAKYAQSKTVQCIAKLDADLFNQPLLLLNHCEIDIEILPNDSKFVLIAPGAAAGTRYHFEVISCKLYVKKLSLTDGLALTIMRKLESTPARYGMLKTMMKSQHISQGRYNYQASLFNDQVPRRIILGLVANEDFIGNIGRSPFNFQHFNLREVSIIANGRTYPQAPYDFAFGEGKYVRAFHDMQDSCGFGTVSDGNGINFAQYGKTHCIFVFNLTNSGENQGGVFDLIKSGTTSVSMNFSAPIPAGGVTLIVMGEFDSILMMDKYRTVMSDTTI
jgi:hypothetical protein